MVEQFNLNPLEIVDILFRKKEEECYIFFSKMKYRDLLNAKRMIMLMESYLIQSETTAFHYSIMQYDSAEARRIISFFKKIIFSEIEKRRRKNIIIRILEIIGVYK